MSGTHFMAYALAPLLLLTLSCFSVDIVLAEEDLVAFEREMALGGQYDADEGASDEMANRDRTVEHYARALSFRPDHPGNIVIEYRIGVLLTQRHDPGKPMVWRRAGP
jgi:hypothetical protein